MFGMPYDPTTLDVAFSDALAAVKQLNRTLNKDIGNAIDKKDERMRSLLSVKIALMHYATATNTPAFLSAFARLDFALFNRLVRVWGEDGYSIQKIMFAHKMALEANERLKLDCLGVALENRKVASRAFGG